MLNSATRLPPNFKWTVIKDHSFNITQIVRDMSWISEFSFPHNIFENPRGISNDITWYSKGIGRVILHTSNMPEDSKFIENHEYRHQNTFLCSENTLTAIFRKPKFRIKRTLVNASFNEGPSIIQFCVVLNSYSVCRSLQFCAVPGPLINFKT